MTTLFSEPGETTRITLLVTQTLEQIGILYAVGGSLASSLHSVMRSTLEGNQLQLVAAKAVFVFGM
jgi:hypothetical protein